MLFNIAIGFLLIVAVLVPPMILAESRRVIAFIYFCVVFLITVILFIKLNWAGYQVLARESFPQDLGPLIYKHSRLRILILILIIIVASLLFYLGKIK